MIMIPSKHIPGADPGFWERGVRLIYSPLGEGTSSRDSKGVWGSADSSPSGVWGKAPAAFCFCVKFTVISNTNIMRYPDY